MRVSHIMTKDIIAISPKTSLVEIVDLMRKHDISSLPVVDDKNYLLGIVRDQDLISHDHNMHLPSYIQFLELLSVEGKGGKDVEQNLKAVAAMPAQKIMEREVPVVRPSTDIRVVASIFAERNISSVPVVNQERKLVGIVCRVDLLDLMQQPKIVQDKSKKSQGAIDYYYEILKL